MAQELKAIIFPVPEHLRADPAVLGYELPVDDRVRVRRRRTSAGRDRIAAAASSRRRLTEVYTDNHFEKKSVAHEAYHLSHGFYH